MTNKDKVKIKLWNLLPPNFPTDLSEAFDDAKRAFWKAVAPAELSKEKMYRVSLQRELRECQDRIEELESVDPNTQIGALEENNLRFRVRIARMQDRIAALEEENHNLKAQLGLYGE